MYDIRGANGTGTSANPVLSKTTNAKAYTVRKLADGNCWMTENLALPLATGVTVEAAHNTSATPYNFTPTSCSTNGQCPMDGNTIYYSSNGQWYYSWYAATAGTVDTGSASGGVDASVSICPVGWRMPANYTASATKSYGSITNAYLGITNTTSGNYTSSLETFPLDFGRDGCIGSGTMNNRGGYGYYISSTTYTSNPEYTYLLAYNTSTLGVQYYNHYKWWGSSLRCVAL